VARRATDDDVARLDLSSWRRAYNGAEPIRAEVIERFVERFRPSGFRPGAIVGSYGLAECTLTVTQATAGVVSRTVDGAALERGLAEPAEGAGARRLVSSGSAATTPADVRIVDRGGGELPERRVGEIWIAGASVAQGYWDDEAATRATFGAELGGSAYLRTGDLGFIWDGELFVTGRLKDLLIVRGRNLYPQDLELTAESSHPALRRNCVAVFPLDDGESERIGLVAEADLAKTSDGPAPLAAAIRAAVSREHDVRVDLVVLVPPRALPKTSSGKVARRRARSRFAGPEAEGVLYRDDVAITAPAPADDGPSEDRDLRAVIAEATGLPAHAIDLDAPASALGLDSLSTLSLVEALSERLGKPLDPASLWRLPSLRAVVESDASPGIVVRPGVGIERGAVSFIELGALALMARAPSQTPYNLFFALELAGAVDAGCLKAALDVLAARHVALRTGFALQDGRFVRVTEPRVDLALPVRDLSDEPDVEAALAAECAGLRTHRFDLARPPLVAAKLLRLAPDRAVLALLVNHAILDAYSFALLLEELGAAYQALKAGRAPELPPLAVDAADVAAALAELHGPTLRKGASAYPPLPAGAFAPPLDRPRPARPSELGTRLPFQLEAGGATAAAAALGLPPAVAVVAAFSVALHRWAARDAVAFNLLHANRRFAGASRVVGFLVYGETVAETIAPGDTWRALLQRAAPWVLEERVERQPYNMLVQPPSLRLLLNYYNRTPPPALGDLPLLLRLDLDPVTYLWDIHDLMVRVLPTPAGLVGDVLFRSEVLDETTVARLVAEFDRALAECGHLDRELAPRPEAAAP
jgi:acyl carrier protein